MDSDSAYDSVLGSKQTKSKTENRQDKNTFHLDEELSTLAQATLSTTPSLLFEGLFKAQKHPYHPVTAPQGIINLGTAENMLCADLILGHLPQLPIEYEDMKYGSFCGGNVLKGILCDFLNPKLNVNPPICPNQMLLASGATSVLCTLSQALMNPGDGVIIPTPYYGAFDSDCVTFAMGKIIPAHTIPSEAFKITIECCQKAYDDAVSRGIQVKMLILTNPHNPLGVVSSGKEMLRLLHWADTHALHVIVDEIYALSIFDQPESFQSCLSMTLPNPSRVHFVWGMSKDFCLNGVRCGVVVSRNERLMKALSAFGTFTCISSLTEAYLIRLFADLAWVDSFLDFNCKALKAAYDTLRLWLELHDISHVPATAGFFVWIRLPISDQEQELIVWNACIAAGVLISAGAAFHCCEPGYFRIVYSSPLLEEALPRLLIVFRSFGLVRADPN